MGRRKRRGERESEKGNFQKFKFDISTLLLHSYQSGFLLLNLIKKSFKTVKIEKVQDYYNRGSL